MNDVVACVPEGVERRIQAPTRSRLVQHRVVVEAFVPRGGRADYGLIAIEFAPSADNSVRLDVPFHTDRGPRWADALAGRADVVRWGLPEEYVGGVLHAVSGGSWPPGVVAVRAAAHGAIGSSSAFFTRVTAAAVHLLHHGGSSDSATAKELRDILV